jgi:energy-coupling factor transporter ATP-binding protein EcfA2
MPGRTPLTVLTGPLGSGKTTLLRHILTVVPRKLAILMNEFGEIAIDTKILQGKNVEMADLGGGCVCCSLLGEFEAAVDEIIATVPGAGIFLMAEYEHTRTGFGAVGKLGLPAEEVAAIATQELLAFHANAAPIDVHLADQLLLPVALAAAPSQYRAVELSPHSITNAWVIEQFGLAKITIDQSTQLVTVTPSPHPPR